MELILFPTRNGNLIGFLNVNGSKRKVFCKKLKEKASTGADKFTCLTSLDSKEIKRIGTIVIENHQNL